jgi:hypothetical protein
VICLDRILHRFSPNCAGRIRVTSCVGYLIFMYMHHTRMYIPYDRVAFNGSPSNLVPTGSLIACKTQYWIRQQTGEGKVGISHENIMGLPVGLFSHIIFQNCVRLLLIVITLRTISMEPNYAH